MRHSRADSRSTDGSSTASTVPTDYRATTVDSGGRSRTSTAPTSVSAASEETDVSVVPWRYNETLPPTSEGSVTGSQGRSSSHVVTTDRSPSRRSSAPAPLGFHPHSVTSAPARRHTASQDHSSSHEMPSATSSSPRLIPYLVKWRDPAKKDNKGVATAAYKALSNGKQPDFTNDTKSFYWTTREDINNGLDRYQLVAELLVSKAIVDQSKGETLHKVGGIRNEAIYYAIVTPDEKKSLGADGKERANRSNIIAALRGYFVEL